MREGWRIVKQRIWKTVDSEADGRIDVLKERREEQYEEGGKMKVKEEEEEEE